MLTIHLSTCIPKEWQVFLLLILLSAEYNQQPHPVTLVYR